MATRKIYLETLTCKENKINGVIWKQCCWKLCYLLFFKRLKKCQNSFQHYRRFEVPPQTCPRRLDPRFVHTHRGVFPLPKMRIQTKFLFSLHLWQPPYLCGFFTDSFLWCFGLSCSKLELQRLLVMIFAELHWLLYITEVRKNRNENLYQIYWDILISRKFFHKQAYILQHLKSI